MMTFGDLLETANIWNEMQTSIRVQTKDKKTLFDSYYATCRFRDCWELKLENVKVISLDYDSEHAEWYDVILSAFEVTLDIDSHCLFLDVENNCYVTLSDLQAEYNRDASEIYESSGAETFDGYLGNCVSKNGALIRASAIDDYTLFNG